MDYTFLIPTLLDLYPDPNCTILPYVCIVLYLGESTAMATLQPNTRTLGNLQSEGELTTEGVCSPTADVRDHQSSSTDVKDCESSNTAVKSKVLQSDLTSQEERFASLLLCCPLRPAHCWYWYVYVQVLRISCEFLFYCQCSSNRLISQLITGIY